MKVTEIQVHAGRTFNHPYESYSNFRPAVTLKATLDDEENTTDAVKQLQAKAEGIVEDHKRNILETLHRLEELSQSEARLECLESRIRDTQKELEFARERAEELKDKNKATVGVGYFLPPPE